MVSANLCIEEAKTMRILVTGGAGYIGSCFGLSPRMRFDLLVNEFVRDAVIDKQLFVYGPQTWTDQRAGDYYGKQRIVWEVDQPDGAVVG